MPVLSQTSAESVHHLPQVLTAAAYKIVMNGCVKPLRAFAICPHDPSVGDAATRGSRRNPRPPPRYMPTVSYLTLLDRYILLCFLYLFFVASQNCMVTLLMDSEKLRPFQNASALLITVSWVAIHVVIPVRLVLRQRSEEKRNVELKNEARNSTPGNGPVRRTSMVRDDRAAWRRGRGRGCLAWLFATVTRRHRVVPVARPPKPPVAGGATPGTLTPGGPGDKRGSDHRGSDLGEEPFSPHGPGRDASHGMLGPSLSGGGASGTTGSLRTAPDLFIAGIPSQASLPPPIRAKLPPAASGGGGNGASSAHFGSSMQQQRGAAEGAAEASPATRPNSAIWRDNALATPDA